MLNKKKSFIKNILGLRNSWIIRPSDRFLIYFKNSNLYMPPVKDFAEDWVESKKNNYMIYMINIMIIRFIYVIITHTYTLLC